MSVSPSFLTAEVTPHESSDADLDGLLTVDELASFLKVPKSWIYGHTRKRGVERLPHIKLGKYLRFFESEVRGFLEHQSRRHGA